MSRRRTKRGPPARRSKKAPARTARATLPAPPPFRDPRISHVKKRVFLAAFAMTGNVSRAAHQATIDRRTHTNWLQQDGVYAEAFAHAKEHAADYLEEVARGRAVKISDTLLIFLLKGLRPEIYRERFEHSGPRGGAIPVALETLTPEELKIVRQVLARQQPQASV